MRNFTILFTSIILLSCQSNSYYAAQNTNQKRFDGWNREDAEFLMKTHDQVLLARTLSETAEARANLRKTYVLSKDTQDEMQDLLVKFKLEAGIKRVKLASSLSKPSDEVIQKLESIQAENFDLIYHQYLSKALREITTLTELYIQNGHTERLKAFSKELKETVAPLMERTEKADLS